MSTYNFTVRATDNAGAFSDRTFSINVNDTVTTTQYDRFVIQGTTGAARSIDGSSWVVDPIAGQTIYSGIAYGNGRWVQWNGSFIRTADTGLSWTAAYQPLLNTISGSTRSVVTCVKYVNNVWRMFHYACTPSTNTQFFMEEYISTDLVNWTKQRDVAAIGTILSGSISQPSAGQGVFDFDYDPIADQWIIVGTTSNASTPVLTRTGSNPWTQIGAITASTVSNGNTSTVKCTNGFWTISNGFDNNLWTSQDGTNWTSRTPVGYTGMPFTYSYQNGRLLAFPCSPTNAATAYGVRESRDGGRMWSLRGTETTTWPRNYAPRTTAAAKLNIATYAGTTIFLTTTADTVLISNDDFATYTTTTIPGLGIPQAVAARDS